MPPVNPVLGHLLILARILSKLPKDAHPHYLPDQLRRAYPEMGPIFYIDGWPFMTFTLVLASPSALAQVTTEHNSPKFPAIKDFLYPLTNGKDIVSMDGREWKMWRNIFNPGFSASHLITVVPDIVKETLMFCKVLQQYAESQSVFSMKNLTDNLAMDVIGKVVLLVINGSLFCYRAYLKQRFEHRLSDVQPSNGRRTQTTDALDGVRERREPNSAVSSVSAFCSLVQYLANGQIYLT